jgi:hypothetical protein
VYLDEGKVYDPEHNPIWMWEWADYMRVQNAFPQQLLVKVED